MAGRLHKVVLALSLPTIVAIVSFYWVRRRRKGVFNNGGQEFDDSQLVVAENKCFDCGLIETSTEHIIANMQLRESSAGNLYANGASKSNTDVNNVTNRNEVQKLNLNTDNDNGKCNGVENADLLNGNDNEQQTSVTAIVDSLSDEKNNANTAFSKLSASYVVVENGRTRTEDESRKICDDDDAADVAVNDSDNVAISEKYCTDIKFNNEARKVDAENDASHNGAIDNSQFNCNNNNNDYNASETQSATDADASENADKFVSKKDELRKRCESTGSNGCYHHGGDSAAQLNNFSDIHSEGSSDSGKGGSDIQGCTSDSCISATEDQVIIYQFELPQELCGRLIGRQGHYVNSIKNETNARVVINRHPFTPYIKICSIEGTRSEIKLALQFIRRRFPVRDYPEVTLQQINVISPVTCPVPVPQSCQLHLPEGVSCDVILSSMVNAGHIFLQQPTHPTYPSLSRLDQFMTATYGLGATPTVPNPTSGIICAVSTYGGWYRAVVVNINNDECEIKFVDYGGYSKIPVSSLRQIRFDFMTLPFQASECYLANVQPTDENGWTPEANSLFEELAQGQILQANIVGYASDGIPFVNLNKIQGASTIFINKELVDRGFAKWTLNHS